MTVLRNKKINWNFQYFVKSTPQILSFFHRTQLFICLCVLFIYFLQQKLQLKNNILSSILAKQKNTAKSTKYNRKRKTFLKVNIEKVLFHIASFCLSDLTTSAENKSRKLLLPLMGTESNLQLESQKPSLYHVMDCVGVSTCNAQPCNIVLMSYFSSAM